MLASICKRTPAKSRNPGHEIQPGVPVRIPASEAERRGVSLRSSSRDSRIRGGTEILSIVVCRTLPLKFGLPRVAPLTSSGPDSRIRRTESGHTPIEFKFKTRSAFGDGPDCHFDDRLFEDIRAYLDGLPTTMLVTIAVYGNSRIRLFTVFL